MHANADTLLMCFVFSAGHQSSMDPNLRLLRAFVLLVQRPDDPSVLSAVRREFEGQAVAVTFNEHEATARGLRPPRAYVNRWWTGMIMRMHPGGRVVVSFDGLAVLDDPTAQLQSFDLEEIAGRLEMRPPRWLFLPPPAAQRAVILSPPQQQGSGSGNNRRRNHNSR
jgi:hypothetical protein